MARCIWCGNWPGTHLHVVVGGRDFYGCPPTEEKNLQALLDEEGLSVAELLEIAKEAERKQNAN